MPQGDRRAPLPGLTALRFFAAAYVLAFHLFFVPAGGSASPSLAQRLLGAGFTGVSCFFILSGFILAYTHPRVPRRRSFYWARFARIYPLYLLALLLALPNFLHNLLRSGSLSQLWAIPADLFLVQSWIPPLAFLVNTPAWTLSTEAFFYALFPFVIGQRWLRPRRPLLLLLGLWAAQLVLPVATELLLVPRGDAALTTLAYNVLFTPLFRLGEFLAGAVLGLMFVQHQAADGENRPTKPWLLPISLAASVALLSFNLTVPHLIVRNGLLLGPFCLLIWALATTPNRILASRPLQLGGEISYGLYILQEPCVRVLYSVLTRTPLHRTVSLPMQVLLLLGFAWIAYILVEKPCRRWLLRHSPFQDAPPDPATLAKPIPTPQPDLP